MKSASDTSKNIGTKLKKVALVLGLHAFSLILLFVLLDILIGVFVFYVYVFPAENGVAQESGDIIKFNSKIYQDVLQQLQSREQIVKGISTEE